MSNSQNLTIKLRLPEAINATVSNFRVQFSVERDHDGAAIFFDKSLGPFDLTGGSLPNEKVVTVSRASIPRFKDSAAPVSLMAYVWMGEKFIESIDCGSL